MDQTPDGQNRKEGDHQRADGADGWVRTGLDVQVRADRARDEKTNVRGNRFNHARLYRSLATGTPGD
jgi:hypothetical protein